MHSVSYIIECEGGLAQRCSRTVVLNLFSKQPKFVEKIKFEKFCDPKHLLIHSYIKSYEGKFFYDDRTVLKIIQKVFFTKYLFMKSFDSAQTRKYMLI